MNYKLALSLRSQFFHNRQHLSSHLRHLPKPDGSGYNLADKSRRFRVMSLATR